MNNNENNDFFPFSENSDNEEPFQKSEPDNRNESVNFWVDFSAATNYGDSITEFNHEQTKLNINYGSSIVLSPFLYKMFAAMDINPYHDLNIKFPQIKNYSKLFSSRSLFKTKMMFFPNIRSFVPINDHYYAYGTPHNLYLFDTKIKQFFYILRAQNSFIKHYLISGCGIQKINVFDDRFILWDKEVYIIVVDLKHLFTPFCYSLRHIPGYEGLRLDVGDLFLKTMNEQQYLINSNVNAFFSLKDNNNENFTPLFTIYYNACFPNLAFLKNDTLVLHNFDYAKFINLKKRKIHTIKDYKKYIVHNVIHKHKATIISDKCEALIFLKKKIKDSIIIPHCLHTIDLKRKIFCYYDDYTYIFDKKKILFIFDCFDETPNIALNERLYLLDSGIDKEKKENLCSIFDSKEKKKESFPIQAVINEIFWYFGKPHYIVTTFKELKVINFENNKELISFNSCEFGIIFTVIVGPNNWLISLTYQKTYLCIWGVNEKRLIKAFPLKKQLTSPLTLFYEGLFLFNSQDLIINYFNNHTYNNYYCNLDDFDSGLQSYKTYYIYDVSKEKIYFCGIVIEGDEKYIIIYHSTHMETIHNNLYKFKYPHDKEYYFNYLLDLENLLIICSYHTILVFDKINNTLLHTKDNFGVFELENGDNEEVPFDYFIPYYCYDGILKINEELILVRERECNQNVYGHVYIYNARYNTIISHIQSYDKNYYCDIFYRFHNGKFALRFKVSYIEIWDFNLMQCNTKIDAIEAQNIKEIDKNVFGIIGDHGIQIMSIKF